MYAIIIVVAGVLDYTKIKEHGMYMYQTECIVFTSINNHYQTSITVSINKLDQR